jgi:hypothetical protein
MGIPLRIYPQFWQRGAKLTPNQKVTEWSKTCFQTFIVLPSTLSLQKSNLTIEKKPGDEFDSMGL